MAPPCFRITFIFIQIHFMKQLLVFLLVSFVFISCEKDDDDGNQAPVTCDVKGTYSGTATATGGSPSPLAYKLQENNFAVGSVTPTGPATTYGGYRNTCDSLIISSWYSSNGNYYILEGKFANNRTVISGNFKNLTTPSDFGTFTLTRL
jgi:hypothetical protein